MPIYGNLQTFCLPDLLRWASAAEKTGVLELERNTIIRRIEFRKGQVGSCSSNDPFSRLGQFLLSRGRIDETQLQHVLTLHKTTQRSFGRLLVELKLLNRAELAAAVAAKAQATVYALFDWDDAFFRFDAGATLDPDQIEVTLGVEQLIEEGQRRTDALRGIRDNLPSSGIVLKQTEQVIPAEIMEPPLAQRVLDSVDGSRTIAEILLRTRASEFPVLQFLSQLCDRGFLEVLEQRPNLEDGQTLLDFRPHAPLPAPTEKRRLDEDEHPIELDFESVAEYVTDGNLDAEIARATALMDDEEHLAAVEVLRGSCREHATAYARRLLNRAETNLVHKVKHDESFAEKIPVLLKDRHELLAQDRPPAEAFLLSMIDGTTDMQSILWLAPLREVDVVIAVQRMVDNGLIELTLHSQIETLVEAMI